MRPDEELSHLIGDIYDATLNSALWPAVLGKAAHFVGGPSAAIYAKDASVKSGGVFYDDGGIEQQFVDLYFNKYVKLDPATTAHFFAEVGEPISTSDVIPYEEFLKTRFYREWARPQHLVDHVTVALEKSRTSVAMFGVFRHERDGIANDDTRRRMRLLGPHVRRAVLIGRVIDWKTSRAGALAAAIDGLRDAVFLVNSRGNIVHTNGSGHAMLADGSVLQASGGKLAAREPDANRALQDVIIAADNGDAAVGSKGIAIPLTDDEDSRFVAHVLPLTSGERYRAAYMSSAVAAVFVREAGLQVPLAPEVIAKAYELTPSELRVLLAVVEYGGAGEIAEALGIAETTVKFHLRNLFQKTGTHRQADLVKLLAGFLSPLAG